MVGLLRYAIQKPWILAVVLVSGGIAGLTTQSTVCQQSTLSQTGEKLPLTAANGEAGDLSTEAVMQKAEIFAVLAGLQTTTIPDKKLLWFLHGRKAWNISWGGDADLYLDAVTGKPIGYYNWKQQEKSVTRRVAPDTPLAVPTPEAASQLAWKYAQLIQYPQAASIALSVRSVEWHGSLPDGQTPFDPTSGSNRALWWVSFQLTVQGYAFASHKVGLGIGIDALDGNLVMFSKNLSVNPVSTVIAISANQAQDLAVRCYSSAVGTEILPTGTSLKMVQPNYLWTDRFSTNETTDAYLAYVVEFPEASVWIDAKSGAVLGGEIMKQSSPGQRAAKPSEAFYGPGEERTKQAILEQFRKADFILVMRREYHPPQASNAPREKDILVSKIRANTAAYRQLIGSLEKPSPLDPSRITKDGRIALRLFILKLMNKKKLIGQYFYRYDQNMLESDPRYRPKPGWIALAPGPQFRQMIEPPAPKDREIRAHRGNSSKTASQHTPVPHR